VTTDKKELTEMIKNLEDDNLEIRESLKVLETRKQRLERADEVLNEVNERSARLLVEEEKVREERLNYLNLEKERNQYKQAKEELELKKMRLQQEVDILKEAKKEVSEELTRVNQDLAESMNEREVYRDKSEKLEGAVKVMVEKFKRSDGHSEVKGLLSQIQMKLSMNKNVESFGLKDEEKQFLVYLLGMPNMMHLQVTRRKSVISDHSGQKKKRNKNKVSHDEIKQLIEHEQEMQILLQTEVQDYNHMIRNFIDKLRDFSSSLSILSHLDDAAFKQVEHMQYKRKAPKNLESINKIIKKLTQKLAERQQKMDDVNRWTYKAMEMEVFLNKYNKQEKYTAKQIFETSLIRNPKHQKSLLQVPESKEDALFATLGNQPSKNRSLSNTK